MSVNAQEYFVGDIVDNVECHMHINADSIIEIELAKEDFSPAEMKLARAMAKPFVSKMMKELEMNLYISYFPEGLFTQVTKFDGENNRSISFCPKLGRIIVNDYDKGLLFVAFPKLNLACQEIDSTHCTKNVQLRARKIENPDIKPELVDGIPCVPLYGYEEYEEREDAPKDTVTVNGVLCVKEKLGWAYADYPFMGYKTEVNSIYGSLKRTSILTPKAIDKNNFILPQNYQVFDDLKKFSKKVATALKKQDPAIEWDETIPENLWSIVQ